MNVQKPEISRKRLVIFSVFVIIAAVFWFLSAMNQEYTTKIDYKVEFIDFPADVRPASAVPEKLQVTIKDYGYNLIGQSGSKHPLKISIKKYTVKDKNDKSKLILSTHLLSDKFFPEASSINILSIDPETVVFKVEKLSTKKVPVKPNLDFSCKPLFMQSDKISISPDSVTISGTEKTIKNILFTETETVKFSDLSDTLKTTCKLKKINGIKFSDKQINIIIPIEKYTENSVNVPLQIQNCPDSLRLITFPNQATITYKVVLSQFKSVKKEDFLLFINYNEIEKKHPEKLKITLKKYPKFLKSVQISPEFVEYVIEKK